MPAVRSGVPQEGASGGEAALGVVREAPAPPCPSGARASHDGALPSGWGPLSGPRWRRLADGRVASRNLGESGWWTTPGESPPSWVWVCAASEMTVDALRTVDLRWPVQPDRLRSWLRCELRARREDADRSRARLDALEPDDDERRAEEAHGAWLAAEVARLVAAVADAAPVEILQDEEGA